MQRTIRRKATARLVSAQNAIKGEFVNQVVIFP